MKCPKCGMEANDQKVCPLCGEPITTQSKYYSIIKQIYKPTWIVLLIWIICCAFNASQIIEGGGIISLVCISLFGAVFYCIISQIICYRIHKKKRQISQSAASVQVPDQHLRLDHMPFTPDFDNMEGHQFEYYCADLLKKNGYSNVIVTQGSGDQGIDILAEKDGIKYGIQCKCYTSDIGNKAVQEAFSGKTFYNCHVAVVLTNRNFTRSAQELAEKNGVLLWGRNKLLSLIHGSGMDIINTTEPERAATVDEARKILQPYIDSMNSRYRNK